MAHTPQIEHVAEQEYRSRLTAIISEGLNPLPQCIFNLDVLLNESVVDLTKVTRELSANRVLSRRVLRLANFGLRQAGSSAEHISDAVVLLGPCLFHAAVLISAVTNFGPAEIRDQNAEALWFHSISMAAVSEKIARISQYAARGVAYVAGLLHDIGHLPLLIAARDPIDGIASAFAPEFALWRDNIELERQYFGLDHCEIGRWMAISWKFSGPLIDAVEHHHRPESAVVDLHLAEIISAAEHLCSRACLREFSGSGREWRGTPTEFSGKIDWPDFVFTPLNETSMARNLWKLRASPENRLRRPFEN